MSFAPPERAWATFLEHSSPLLLDVVPLFEREPDAVGDCYVFHLRAPEPQPVPPAPALPAGRSRPLLHRGRRRTENGRSRPDLEFLQEF